MEIDSAIATVRELSRAVAAYKQEAHKGMCVLLVGMEYLQSGDGVGMVIYNV